MVSRIRICTVLCQIVVLTLIIGECRSEEGDKDQTNPAPNPTATTTVQDKATATDKANPDPNPTATGKDQDKATASDKANPDPNPTATGKDQDKATASDKANPDPNPTATRKDEDKATATGKDSRIKGWRQRLIPNQAVEGLRQMIVVVNKLRNFVIPGNSQACLKEIEAIQDDIGKYQKLRDMQNADTDSFYSCLITHVDKLLPIVYTPIVGDICLNYGRIKGDRGLMLRITEEDKLRSKLEEWKRDHPKTRAIVVTDGGRILGLGDLGANGMGIPIGKMIIYSALGGVDPQFCLPVTLDVGTNNKKLRESKELYVGLDQDRVTGDQYDKFVDNFVKSAVDVFGKHTLVQFEDFALENAFRFLDKYQKKKLTVFNDDIQGTAAVALAGILAAERVSTRKLEKSKILFAGAGGAGIGIASLLVAYLMEKAEEQGRKLTKEDASKQIYFKRSKKLIMVGDKFDGDIYDEKRKLFAKTMGTPEVPQGSNIEDLLEIIKWLKPNILIGVSSVKGLFSKEVLEEMAKHSDNPIIFALSNPLTKSECTAEEAYVNTEGRALFASGSPFDPVTYKDRVFYPRQCNNAYVFPGVALAIVAAELTEVPEEVFLMAAKTVNDKCTKAEDVNVGSLFPPLDRLRQCSVEIATEIATYAFDKGISALKDKPADVKRFIIDHQYTPSAVPRSSYETELF